MLLHAYHPLFLFLGFIRLITSKLFMSLSPRAICARGRLLLLSMAVVGALTACGGGDANSKFVGGTAAETYNIGLDLYKNGNPTAAAKTFEKIPYLFPYSKLIKNAQLMTAYSYYMAEDKVNAAATVDVFLSLYPSDPLVAYALYLRGMSYFEQIEDVRRDQGLTEEAVRSFQQLIKAYPDTIYGRDAASKAGLLIDQLAGKEMTVGRFYPRPW